MADVGRIVGPGCYATWRLEDGAFANLEPEKYDELRRLLAETRASREQHINEGVAALSIGPRVVGFSSFFARSPS